MTDSPLTTEGNGRGPDGKFLRGNKVAKGNPHASVVAKLRTAALAAVPPKDLAAIMRELVKLALAGDVAAAREVLQRTLGPPVEADLLARLDDLETLIMEKLSHEFSQQD